MFSDIRYLEVPLPEDIEKMKWHGDFARAQRVIARRLNGELPQALRKRLELEQEILRRMPEHYPYTWDEAFQAIRTCDPSVTREKMEELFENNQLEWIYINGEIHFHELVVSNFDKTRVKGTERQSTEQEALRDACIRKMKEQGGMALQYRVRVSLKLSEAAERPGQRIRVDLPLPVICTQIRHTELLSVTPSEETNILVAPEDSLNRSVCIETVCKPGQVYTAEYSFENRTYYTHPDPEKVSDSQPDFYTEEQAPHIHFTPYLRALTEEVVGEEKNPLLKAKRIYEYITSHVQYSFMRAYATITDITQYAAAGLKGDCGVQALLFITMCRIAGIPARWQAGQYANPADTGSHDWAQFYIAPYGWLFADCSFGGRAYREQDQERREFYFGNLDPYRIPMAAEFQQDFIKPSSHFRNDPYDNQVGEVAFEDRNLHHHEFETRYEILECREVSLPERRQIWK